MLGRLLEIKRQNKKKNYLLKPTESKSVFAEYSTKVLGSHKFKEVFILEVLTVYTRSEYIWPFWYENVFRNIRTLSVNFTCHHKMSKSLVSPTPFQQEYNNGIRIVVLRYWFLWRTILQGAFLTLCMVFQTVGTQHKPSFERILPVSKPNGFQRVFFIFSNCAGACGLRLSRVPDAHVHRQFARQTNFEWVKLWGFGCIIFVKYYNFSIYGTWKLKN